MKKETKPKKNTNENTLANLTDSRIDQITAYIKKGEKQSDFIKFETSETGTGVAVSIIGVWEDNGEASFERRTALYESTGMLQITAGAQLLSQIASCENPKGAVEAEVALEKASCMMMELQPQDPFEGQLIGQMVATHNQAMDCIRRANLSEQTSYGRELNLRFGDRFLRTYAIQMEALSKHRRGGQQKVVVEHVHVHEGGQAVVGNIENHRGGSDEKK